MSMNDALNEIEAIVTDLMHREGDTPETYREAFVASGLVHKLRRLSPGMEMTVALQEMAALHAFDEWTEREYGLAVAYVDGVEMFLEGVRIGYREGARREGVGS